MASALGRAAWSAAGSPASAGCGPDTRSRGFLLLFTDPHLASRRRVVAALRRELEETVVVTHHPVIADRAFAQMEYLAKVRDSSTDELHDGYWCCDITAAEVKSSEIVPLYQKLYSAEAKEFRSENAEILAAVDSVRSHTRGRGIWALDRGADRREVLEPLLERRERFVIRSTGKRFVIDRRRPKGSVAEVGGRCRLHYAARVIKIEEGKEKVYELRYGAEPLHLPGREEKMLLVWWPVSGKIHSCC
jgi:hypothetical protein